MILLRTLGVTVLVWVCGSLSAAAQSDNAAPSSPRGTLRAGGRGAAAVGSEALVAGPPRITAIRAAQAPKIDGSLDDPIWQSAATITNFVQERPLEGAAASEATEVYFAYNAQYIFVGIYAHYSDPSLIRANRADRDRTDRDDTVAVFFDPFMDQQRGYSFSVNAYGVQADSLLTSSGGGGGGGGGEGRGGGGRGGGGGSPGDSTWDALFNSAGRMVEDGWTAEMAIPFKSLRYPSRAKGQAHRWGFQVQRDIASKNESVVWAPVSRDVMGFLRQFGVLEGMSDLSTSRNLEILPTVTALGAESISTTTATYSRENVQEAGVGVKYGLTSNLILDATFNPDFSQIESDRAQIQVNQRFALFFPELRPFFLEGQEIFNLPGPINLVHTRTIVDPRYGGKVTGKIGKATLGVLVADDEAPGHMDDTTSPYYGESARVLVGRTRYDLGSDSNVGMIVTDREFGDSYSRVGGFDGQARIGRNQRLGFRLIGAAHRDTTGIDRRGGFGEVSYRKEGRQLSYSMFHFQVSPDFRTDTGFVRRVNQRQTSGNVGYRWWPQGTIINWGPRVNYSRNYAFDGTLQDEQMSAGVNLQFSRSINVNANFDNDMERYLGVNFQKKRMSMGGGVNTSRKVSFGGFASFGDQVRYVVDPFLGAGSSLNFFATFRPVSRLQSELNINTSRLTDRRNSSEVFDIKIYRSLTTYQFTPRLLMRNILDFNDYDHTFGTNLLVTYRVNSGTALFVGYDDRYMQGDLINATLLPVSELRRTNSAIFTKLQVLLRY